MTSNVSYTRQSLAKMFFPEKSDRNARRSLYAWIKKCRPLDEALNRGCGAFDHRRDLTIREVKLIFDYLGNPEDEPPKSLRPKDTCL